jgi:hypothetical protein
MRITEGGIVFTAEEIMAAAEPDDRADVEPGREPSEWMVEYDIHSLFFGTDFTFKQRCDTEDEARKYAADHPLAENLKVYPIYPLSAIRME